MTGGAWYDLPELPKAAPLGRPEQPLITFELIEKVEDELLDIYDGTEYEVPTPVAVIADVLRQMVVDLHDMARDLTGCREVDTCRAEAIVARHLADRLSAITAELDRGDVLTELVVESEKAGLYDIEITPCSCGRMPPCRHLDDPDHPPVEPTQTTRPEAGEINPTIQNTEEN